MVVLVFEVCHHLFVDLAAESFHARRDPIEVVLPVALWPFSARPALTTPDVVVDLHDRFRDLSCVRFCSTRRFIGWLKLTFAR